MEQAIFLRRAHCGQSLFFSAARLALNMPCQAMGARGGRKSGMNGCQGASWSEELDGREFCGALSGERELEPRECPVSWTASTHPPSFTTVWYADFKV